MQHFLNGWVRDFLGPCEVSQGHRQSFSRLQIPSEYTGAPSSLRTRFHLGGVLRHSFFYQSTI